MVLYCTNLHLRSASSSREKNPFFDVGSLPPGTFSGRAIYFREKLSSPHSYH